MNLLKVTRNKFGILQEYQRRASEKLFSTHKILPTPKFFTTPTRPSNFQDHVDVKV